MHVPEEIIHAAGILPAIILGSDEPITLANSYLQPHNCALVRSNLDMALTGKLDFLDGMVFPDICDSIQCVSDVWKRHKPGFFYHSLLVPARMNSPSSRQFLTQQFIQLKASLEKFMGQEISHKALGQSLAIYNHNRALLSRFSQLRRENPSLLRAKDLAIVVTASMLMPKEEHSQLLTELLSRAQKARPVPDGKPRLVLSGNLCDDPDQAILDLIEEVGAVVADDDLYVGTRYFATQADETLDPIEALAKRYIHDVPCPTKHNPQNDWADYLLGLVKQAKANGVIVLMLKYCEPHAFDYPYLKSRLSESGVPSLLLETEHGKAPLGPIRTRLQAFLETIEGGVTWNQRPSD